jgi:hypothetical protein
LIGLSLESTELPIRINLVFARHYLTTLKDLAGQIKDFTVTFAAAMRLYLGKMAASELGHSPEESDGRFLVEAAQKTPVALPSGLVD